MIIMIQIVVVVFIIYFLIAWQSHYEAGLMGGSLFPSWFCIFCLVEKVIKIKEGRK